MPSHTSRQAYEHCRRILNAYGAVLEVLATGLFPLSVTVYALQRSTLADRGKPRNPNRQPNELPVVPRPNCERICVGVGVCSPKRMSPRTNKTGRPTSIAPKHLAGITQSAPRVDSLGNGPTSQNINVDHVRTVGRGQKWAVASKWTVSGS